MSDYEPTEVQRECLRICGDKNPGWHNPGCPVLAMAKRETPMPDKPSAEEEYKMEQPVVPWWKEKIASLEQALRESREEVERLRKSKDYESALRIWSDELKLLTGERDSLRTQLADCQAAFQVVKDACDRDWTTETPREIAAIASNAMFWRNEEIRKLRDRNAELSKPVTDELIEELAALEHERWSLQAGAALVDMTEERRTRWYRQSRLPYAELTEEEKEKDRQQVRKTLAILSRQPKASQPEDRQ